MSNISSNFLAISPSVNNSPFSFFTLAVPLVFTKKPTGLATPIAYATCTRISSATPAATIFLAICRVAYAAERSTFDESFPEKAPPPWAPCPP